MKSNWKEFKRGLLAGVPIGLGYLSVAFTFGIMGVSMGLTWWETLLISMTTVTSAGQFAALGIMVCPGQYIQMLIAQITINIRYSFMSISLAQKADASMNTPSRALLGFMMTDEVFAVASQERAVSRIFFAGLSVLPYLGWSLGTLLGAVLGSVLPDRVISAMGLAIYGMFIAIVIPELKKSRPVAVVCLIAVLLSCAFTYLPVLSSISSGLVISICAILAAAIGAVLYPISETNPNSVRKSDMNLTQYVIYLAIIAGSTYLIRAIPFTLAKNKVQNRFIQSFLYYIPYAVLTVMTIPAVFTATSSVISAVCGVIAAVLLAYKGKGLTTVAIISCVVVFLAESVL